ncbi:MAG: glutamate--tRNA ligase [Hyphomicrobiaceae bacterium]|nr:glutamate--tRNA ligase [Hyphomicrobiaceae bacterium]MCC0006959.1 glutamate--tRNA ligase [Hyphomicrobiaceae bacterium]
MGVAVRFAPSPTGRLHIGNVRTAVLNYLYALKTGGRFLLRMDDTDTERSTEEFAEGIRRELDWLGLTTEWHARQSDRIARYDEVADRLKASGRLYPCYESEDELERRRRRQMARGLPPIYDRAALKLTDAERAAFDAEGRKLHWRLRLPNTDGADELRPLPTIVSWNDMVRGDQMVDLGSLSDPVLIRADGTYLYTFSSVVDDVDFAITHILRGADHITNTGVQIALFEALGAVPPAFGHHNLLVDSDGKALSKRIDSLSVAGLRDAGYEPMAINAHAALVGTSDAIVPHTSLATLAEAFDPARISPSPARFDVSELDSLNARLLHMLEFSDVSERLAAMGIPAGENFWLAVRGNLARLSDANDWWQVVDGEVVPVIEDGAFLQRAADLLPPEPWDQQTWGAWTSAVKKETGAKGRALFHPLRLALTGREAGPELKALLPLIGRERALKRLRG